MPGKNLHLKPLAARKQILLVESELNRAQLIAEVRDLKNEIEQFKDQVHALGSLASSASKMAATVSAIGSAFTHRHQGSKKKTSWVSTLLNGARTGVSLWGAWRSLKRS